MSKNKIFLQNICEKHWHDFNFVNMCTFRKNMDACIFEILWDHKPQSLLQMMESGWHDRSTINLHIL